MDAEQNRNITSSILEQATKSPAKIACEFIEIADSPIQLTYTDLWLRLNQIGFYLARRGAQIGDRIIISLSHGLNYLISFYGCLSQGLVAVPICAISRESQWNRIFHVVEDCKARFILVDDRTIGVLENALEKAQLENITLINIDKINFSEINKSQFLIKDIKTFPIAFLQYTSGSTGNPKGVMVSHKNLIANFYMMQEGTKIGELSKVVSWLPLFHDMGLIGSGLLTIYSGATLYLMSPLKFLRNPFAWLEAISKYRATHAYAPNFAYDVLASQGGEYTGNLDLESWLVALSGAEPIRFRTAQRFIASFTKYGFQPETFYPAYGMAESTLYITGSDVRASLSYDMLDATSLQQRVAIQISPDDPNKQVVISCGKPRDKSEIFIINHETLELCPSRQVGEIWVKGEHVCEGYFGKENLTEKVFRAYSQDKKIGPCLRTGDLGYLNERGELFVTGRIKDVIIINGKNFFPHDIEETIQQSSELLTTTSIAAFSVEGEEKEELVVVIEFRTNLDPLNAKKLEIQIKKEILKEHGILAYQIVFGRRGSVPRTTSGKLQRQLCKKNLLQNLLPRIEFCEKEVGV